MSAPHVSVQEIDKSTRVPSFPGLYGAIVIPSNRGPLIPTLITSQRELLEKYTLLGKTFRGISSAFYSAEVFLQQSNKLWVTRAAKDPLYGGLEVRSKLLNANVGVTLTIAGESILATVVFPEMPEIDDLYNVDALLTLTSGDLEGATITWKSGVTIVGDPFVVPAGLTSIRLSEAFNFGPTRLNLESGKTYNWTFEIEDLAGRSFTVKAESITWSGTYSPEKVIVLGSSTPTVIENTAGITAGMDDPTSHTFTEDIGAFLVYGSNPGSWNNSIGIKLFTYENNPQKVKLPGAMMIEVYLNGNENVPVENPLLVSRDPAAKDGYNRSIYMDSKSTESEYIRLFDNPLVPVDAKFNDITTVKWLTSGHDGAEVTDGSMMTALSDFDSKETYPMTVIMDGGWTTPAYQLELIKLAEKRTDCVAMLSIPYAAEAASDFLSEIVSYRQNDVNNGSSFAAIYSPHLKVYDKDRDEAIFISPDGFAAAAVSSTASNYEIWYPAAGWRRGRLNVLDTRRRYNKGQMDYLYDNNINPIRFAPGKGICIWGQKTLQWIPSDLDRLNVRFMLIVVQTALSEALEDFIFELNTDAERLRAKTMIDVYMTGIQGRNGVYEFECVSDSSNNSPTDIENYRMNVDLYLKPTKSIEYVQLRTILTPTGVDFSVLKNAV